MIKNVYPCPWKTSYWLRIFTLQFSSCLVFVLFLLWVLILYAQLQNQSNLLVCLVFVFVFGCCVCNLIGFVLVQVNGPQKMSLLSTVCHMQIYSGHSLFFDYLFVIDDYYYFFFFLKTQRSGFPFQSKIFLIFSVGVLITSGLKELLSWDQGTAQLDQLLLQPQRHQKL